MKEAVSSEAVTDVTVGDQTDRNSYVTDYRACHMYQGVEARHSTDTVVLLLHHYITSYAIGMCLCNR